MNVIVSAAVSADGCLDDLAPRRLILSSPEDWREVYRLRASCGAILVGAETVRKDNPSLVIRDEALRNQRIADGLSPDIVKVTLSRTGDLSPGLRFFSEGGGEKIVFLSADAPVERRKTLESVATVVVLAEVSASSVVAELARRGIEKLMVEGGSHVLGMFFAEGMVDQFRLAVAPFLVGQPGAPRLVTAGCYPDAASGRRMTLMRTEQLGDMAVMHYRIEKRAQITTQDYDYLQLAIGESRQSPPSDSAYRVGAVVVTLSGRVYRGYTHESAPDNHAEEEAIQKALSARDTLYGATIYASMEPCSKRRSKPRSCSQLIVEHQFARVVFAMYEPDRFATCCGAQRLRDAGIRVDVIDELAPLVRDINAHLLE